MQCARADRLCVAENGAPVSNGKSSAAEPLVWGTPQASTVIKASNEQLYASGPMSQPRHTHTHTHRERKGGGGGAKYCRQGHVPIAHQSAQVEQIAVGRHVLRHLLLP